MKNRKTNGNVANTILSTFIVIVLIVATVAIGFFSTGFRNWNKEDWENVWNETFEKDPTPEQGGGSVTDENGNELDQTAVNPMPAVLNFTSNALALASGDFIEVIISATVTPTSALNKAVDWSVGWADGSDKSDLSNFLTVTPDSDGSNVASVKCYKPFTKEIVITVITRDGGYSATCTVRYVGLLSAIDITFDGVQKDTDGAFIFDAYDQNRTFTGTMSLSNIFGDVTDNSSSYSYTVNVENVGEVTNDLVCIDYYSSKWGYHTYEATHQFGASSRQLVHDSMKFTISDNTITATMKLVPFMHYDSTESEGDNVHYKNRVAFVGLADLLYPSPSENYEIASKNSIISYANQNVTAIENQKIKVTITETNTGVSTSFYFKYRYGVSVTGVSLDKSEITY